MGQLIKIKYIANSVLIVFAIAFLVSLFGFNEYLHQIDARFDSFIISAIEMVRSEGFWFYILFSMIFIILHAIFAVTCFDECWRVLKTYGTLVFKWNERQITAGRIISDVLYGQKERKNGNTTWLCFMKMPKDQL